MGRRKAPEPSSPTGLVHKAQAPVGIQESTLPADWYLPALLSLTVLTKILRFTQDDEWEAWLPSHQPLATSNPRPEGP